MSGTWLRRHADLAIGVGIGLLLLVEIAIGAEHPLRLLPLVPVLIAAVWLRRRVPFVAPITVGGTVLLSGVLDPGFLDEGGLSWLAAWVLAHYTLGRWTTGQAAWFAPALVLGGTFALLLSEGQASLSDTGDIAYFLSMTALPWLAGLVARLRHDHLEALRAENLRLEREQEEAARRAVAEERTRIARELHDVVSHAISVTVLQARGARRTLGVDETQVRKALDAIEQTNTAALGDMRRLLAVLRDTEEEPDGERQPQPSLAHLDRLVAQVRDSGLPVEVEVEGSANEVPPGVDLSGYRIVQEALTNAMKHAGDATARVCLSYSGDALAITVRDTGDGSGGGDGAGSGLIGIRERVAVVGGEVTAGPVPGGGFQVSVRLPYSLELA